MLDTQSQTKPRSEDTLRTPLLVLKFPTDHFLMHQMFDKYKVLGALVYCAWPSLHSA